MSYIGQFVQWERLYAADLNKPFAMCVMRTTTAQTITTATATTASFDNADEIVDSLSWHDSATFPARVYPTITGLYMIDASWQLSGAGGTGAFCGIAKNGTYIAVSAGDQSGATNASLSCSVVINVTAGDYVDSIIYQNAGANRNTALKSFSVVLLGTT